MLELKENFEDLLTDRIQFEDYAVYVHFIIAYNEKGITNDIVNPSNDKLSNVFRFLDEHNNHSEEYHNMDFERRGELI